MLTARDVYQSRQAARAKPRRIITVRPWINVTPVPDPDVEGAVPERRIVKIGELIEVEPSLAEDLVSSGHARYFAAGDPLPTQAEVRIVRPIALAADGKRVAEGNEAGARAVASDNILRVPIALARELIDRGFAQPWALC